MKVKNYYDVETATLTYLVYNEQTKDAVLIDPVLNYDAASGKVSFESIEEVKKDVESLGLNLHYLLETHAHADHLSGAYELKKIFPNAKTVINSNITLVQEVFAGVFNLETKTDGSQFDILMKEGDKICAGTIEIELIETPGHTPACGTYLIANKIFTGDTLFMPDFGTGRCDFPKGDAEKLFNSIHEKLYKLPDDTEVYVGHDYMPNGRELKFKTTIGESKRNNIHVKDNTSSSEFVNWRRNRDKELKAPKLLLPSIQVNIEAGKLPEEENNGTSYLKIPLNLK